MSTLRTRTVLSSLRIYFDRHKKVIISAVALFALGIALGIIFAYRAVDGSFERVARCDVETGGAKVFFISVLAIAGCYGVLLIAGINNKTAFLICIPFVTLGYFCGKYACGLVGRYEGFGVINLVIIYLPFFVVSFVLMTIAAANIFSSSCSDYCESSSLRPSFVRTLKIFGINAACSLVFFLIIGSFTGVIIVTLF